jgi:succinoglycan biosynthesis protein ExoM
MIDRLDVRVCIAIPTFRRPLQLRALLLAIDGQQVPDNVRVDVVVLDNDDTSSASWIVAEKLLDRFSLAYRHISRPGLCMVRNEALKIGLAGYDFLAMIDDDEVPCPSWLFALMATQAATNADGVIGPVIQRLPPDAPKWLRAGGFYDLPAYSDGSALSYGYSGNCLLSVPTLAAADVAFSPALNFAGGEDMFFFQQLVGRGARLVFSSAALATEDVPAARISLGYLMRLSFRRGNTLAFCDRSLRGSAKTNVSRFLKATGRIVFGGLSLVPLTLARGRTGACVALLNIAQGLGGLSGLTGHIYNAYKRDSAAAI